MTDDPKRDAVAPKDQTGTEAPVTQPAEHPRRVHAPVRQYGDKQLRRDRVRGGFDTK